jgi:type IV pilus assembly protein PilC
MNLQNKNATSIPFYQKEIKFGKAFKDKAKEHFYGEFASLLESGVDIQRALNLLIEEQEKKQLKAILEEILNLLTKGASLSEALKTTTHFTPYEYQSIRIGEEAGKLQQVLISLAEYFGEKVKLQRQLISVFTYPAVVLCITIGVLYFMLNSVVPMFEDVFKQFGQDLPPLTQKIIWLSEHFGNFMLYFLIVVIGCSIYAYTQRNESWFRRASAQFVLKIPIVGPLLRKIYLARFCQSMSLLVQSKTPLIQALELVEEMIRFYPIEIALQSIRKEIMMGNSLHAGLSKFPIFDRRMVSLVKIAEEINQLDTTFERLTKQNNEDIEYRTKLMGTIIEPAIIVLIGAIVGVIMVAMYLPMFNLSNVIK